MSIIVLSAVGFSLNCHAQENATASIKGKSQLSMDIEEFKYRQNEEIEKFIASTQYDAAWKAVVHRLETLRGNINYDKNKDMILLTWIALYGSTEENILKERFAFIQEYIIKEQRKILDNYDQNESKKRDNLSLACRDMAMMKVCHASASLALAKDEIKKARDFLKLGSMFAQGGEFIYLCRQTQNANQLASIFGGTHNYGIQDKDTLWALIQDLLVLRENDEAIKVMERQWEFLYKPLSFPQEEDKQRLSVIHALAQAKLADMLRSRGNIPDAAQYYRGALASLNKLMAVDKLAKNPEIVIAHQEVNDRINKHGIYDIWFGMQEENRESLLDAEPLKKELESILNAYIAALVKGDIKTASHYVTDADSEKQENELKKLAEEIQWKKIAVITYFSLQGVSNIPEKANTIKVDCKIKVGYIDGKEKIGKTVYVFVRAKDGWKINLFFNK
jgi:hypothetical protein